MALEWWTSQRAACRVVWVELH